MRFNPRYLTVSALVILLASAVALLPIRPVVAQSTSVAPSTSVPTGKALVTGMHSVLSRGNARIILDLSQDAKYEVRRIGEDPTKGMPPRIYVDIQGAQLALVDQALPGLPLVGSA